jgi:hypothetical protein
MFGDGWRFDPNRREFQSSNIASPDDTSQPTEIFKGNLFLKSLRWEKRKNSSSCCAKKLWKMFHVKLTLLFTLKCRFEDFSWWKEWLEHHLQACFPFRSVWFGVKYVWKQVLFTHRFAIIAYVERSTREMKINIKHSFSQWLSGHLLSVGVCSIFANSRSFPFAALNLGQFCGSSAIIFVAIWGCKSLLMAARVHLSLPGWAHFTFSKF